jgi:TatD DNase family protein
MLIDTHAHLDFPDFEKELDLILERAAKAGVTRVITIGTTVEGSRRAVTLAERYPNVFATIGIHPSNADSADDNCIAQLRELAASPRVVALGEMGLDYHRLPGAAMRRGPFNNDALRAIGFVSTELPGESQADFFDVQYKARQAEIFQQQLELATELGLSVVIHERDAWADTLDLLAPYNGRVRAVFHCFGKSIDQARVLIAEGHLVSFTGIVTFKNAQVVQDCAAQVPADAFMVETDCPYLAPAPHRGKRCEPSFARITAEKIAALRDESLEQIAAETTKTAETFFAFPR